MKTAIRLFLLLVLVLIFLLVLYGIFAEAPKVEIASVTVWNVAVSGTDTPLSRRSSAGGNASIRYRNEGGRPFSVGHLAQNISTASTSIVSSREEPSEGHILQHHNASLSTVRTTTNATTNVTHSPSLQSATLKSLHDTLAAVHEDMLCKLPNCMDVLSLQEKSHLKKCEMDTIRYLGHQPPKATCQFMRVEKVRNPVALNSQEGSGNTWLRGLLEKATGICTGFYACDVAMRAQGFLGESIMSGHVLVVKTHVHIPQWVDERSSHKFSYENPYGSGIYLIRNPAHAVIAEWNRLVTVRSQKGNSSRESHINVIAQEKFKTDEWVRFCEKYIERWKERTINWVLNNHKHPVHVVNYEDLKRDTVREVEKILDFLHFPYSHDELTERLREDYTVFQRPHTHDNFEHFSPEQKKQLKNTLLTVLDIAKDSGKEELFLFNDYLESLPDVV